MMSWIGVSAADAGSTSTFAPTWWMTAHAPSGVSETAGPSTVTTPYSAASRRNAAVGSPYLAVHADHRRRPEEGVIPSVAPSPISAERISAVAVPCCSRSLRIG